jgi:predicted alpha/beta-hydrolase family hydrolase
MAKRLILLAHGAGGASNHPWMDKWAKLLEPLGRVVRFDYPFAQKNKALDAKLKADEAAKAATSSDVDADEEAENGAENGNGRGGRRRQGQRRHQPDPLKTLIQAHRDAITEAKKDGEKVVLIGKSMGGRVGCHVSLEEGVAVDGIVCLGYPLQAQGRRVRGTRDEVLRELRNPVMFVQGTRDRMCPIRSLDAIRQDLEVPNYIHVVEGGDHSLIVRKTQLDEAGKKQDDLDRAAVDAIKAFLDKHVPV